MSIIGDASLYIHIPFCKKKCPYCHFFVLPDEPDGQKNFHQSLIKEWNLKKRALAPYNLRSIYFGGGTPSLFSLDYLASVIQEISPSKEIEITIEANPEDVTLKLASAWRSLGINRVSLGIQTFDSSLLAFLQRGHDKEKTLAALDKIFLAGFTNVSIDLMFELPHQTLESFRSTLEELKFYPITHLSLYNLAFEPGSAFFKKRKSLQTLIFESGLEMLQSAIDFLETKELKRYEISAFSKEGYQSVHNTGYWTYRPFLGLGPSAVSYFDRKRSKNISHLKKWMDAVDQQNEAIEFSEILDHEAHLKERIAIGLRLLKGLSLEDLPQPIPSSIFNSLEKLSSEGFLTKVNSHIKLTEKGLLFYDSVAEDLL